MENLVTLLEKFGITLYVQCAEYEPRESEIDGIHELTSACTPIEIINGVIDTKILLEKKK